MAIETKYIVKRAFKYGGHQLRQGDEFTPDGGMWDKQLIENGELITVVNTVVDGPAAVAPEVVAPAPEVAPAPVVKPTPKRRTRRRRTPAKK